MSISVIETIGGAIAPSGTGSPTITTSLVSTDRVVVVIAKSGTASGPSVSGLGATWTSNASNTTTYDMNIFSAAGITGGGTLTLSGFTSSGDYVVYVLRSSIATTPYLVSGGGSATTVSAVAAGTLCTLSGVAVPAGGFAVSASQVSAGTVSYPEGTSVPASGWTADRTGTYAGRFISRQITADTTVTTSLTSTSGYSAALIRGLYYDDSAPTALTNTFVGWGNPIF